MLEKEQVAGAAWAEMLRYSVAISAQLERIDHWKKDLRHRAKTGETPQRRRCLMHQYRLTSLRTTLRA